MARDTTTKTVQTVGALTLRFGLALNLLAIGRLKFESYEVENIRPLIVSSPPFARLAATLGERRLARLIGMTEIVIGSLIAAKPLAPKASALGSLAAVGMFTSTLSFLITTPEAWQETGMDPKLSLAGQFLLKDVVLLGASLLTAAESLRDVSVCSRPRQPHHVPDLRSIRRLRRSLSPLHGCSPRQRTSARSVIGRVTGVSMTNGR